MGFLSRLVDDVLDAGEKIVRSPTRVFCAVMEHEWRPYGRDCRVCVLCGKREPRP